MYRRPLPDWKSEYLDPELETMSREQIEALQVERLKATVAHCMNNPVYKERLEKAGVTAESITSVDDIRRIPFTTKQDPGSYTHFRAHETGRKLVCRLLLEKKKN